MLWFKKTQERLKWTNVFYLDEMHLQEAVNNSLENTSSLRQALTLSGNGLQMFHSQQPDFLSVFEEQNKQAAQSPDTFPSNFHSRMCSFSA